jgi:coproporphyrinogen III oxidase
MLCYGYSPQLVLLFIYSFIHSFQKWEYMHTPNPQSKEWNLLEVLRSPRDWLAIEGAEK